MKVSQKRNPTKFPAILLEGEPLEQVNTFKYLGVIISDDLSWTTQVHSVCTKAKKIVRVIYRRFHNAEANTLFQLPRYIYTTLVRPHLEYVAPVWDPFTAGSINKLESVQKFALRICFKQWNLGYQDLLDLTNCPSLLNGRLYFKLCTLYRIVHNLAYFPPNVVLPKQNSNTSVPLLYQPFARTTAYHSSFLPSSATLWNNLPYEAIAANTIHSFKSLISPHFFCL